MKTLDQLSEELYRDIDPLLPERIAPYVADILQHDAVSIMAYNFKRYQLSYGESLLLSVPPLWSGLTRQDWLRLIQLMEPRPTVIKGDFRLMDTGGFGDLLFLHKYLRVNPFPLLVEAEISESSRTKIYEYTDVYQYLFFRETEEELIEDLMDFYALDISYLTTVTTRLIENEGFTPALNSAELELFLNKELGGGLTVLKTKEIVIDK